MIEFSLEKFKDETYILAGKKGTFYRYCNSEFRNKWTGFWIYDLKIFDYFAIKGSTWHSKDNIKKFYYNFAKARHEYENGIEEIVVAEKEPGMIIRTFTDEDILFEIGINIRDKSEKYKVNKYDVKTYNNRITINTGKEKVIIFFSKGIIKNVEYFKRVHYPIWNYMRTGYSKQEILQLNVWLNTNETEIRINFGRKLYKTFDDIYDEKVRIYENVEKYAENIHTTNPTIKKLLKIASLNLELLLKEKNRNLYLYAGYPWFLEMWGRDTAISLLAFIFLRRYKIVERLLKTLKKNDISRLIPPREKEDLISVDAPVFLLYSLLEFIKETQKKEFGPYVSWLLDRILEYDIDRDHLIEVGFSNIPETWMDSIKRTGKATEINSYWIKSLEKIGEVFPHLSLDTSKLKIYFESKVVKDGIIRDTSDSYLTTPNILPAIQFKIFNENVLKNSLRYFEEKHLVKYGITTYPIDHPEFGSSEYHKGSSWWLTNFWYLMAKAEMGEKDKIDQFLDILNQQVFSDLILGFPENYDPLSNKILGCGMQAWSAALFIYFVAKYLQEEE